MPYIKQERRVELDIYDEGPDVAGELNYEISRLIKNYLDKKGTFYQTMNDVIGALEGAKLEFYRRVVAPYENVKIGDNGDVYE